MIDTTKLQKAQNEDMTEEVTDDISFEELLLLRLTFEINRSTN